MSTQLDQPITQAMNDHFVTIQLVQPTDFLILEAFADGDNYTAGAIAYRIKHTLDTDYDVSKENVNNRLPKLEGYGLLEKTPTIGRSGLYYITEEGRIALEYQDKYDSPDVDFVGLIERELEKASGV